MAWYAVCEVISGNLVSIASVLAEPLPAHLIALPLAAQPDLSATRWNAALRLFETRPAKVLRDRWDDLLTNATYTDFQTVYNGLNTANKTRLQNILLRLFGNLRFRNASEAVELG